jgi:trk system potassium uptake protein TrkH
MRDRLNIQEATDQPGMTGLIGYLMNVLRLTLVVEGIGMLLIALQTVPEFGLGRGMYLALFHAVSAFNNAGFSLFPTNAVYWQHNGFVLTVLATLVIIGGLGYNVNTELVRRYLQKHKAQPKWNVLLKLVLGMTAVLLVLGTLIIWLYERRNPATLGGLSLTEQLANAFFLSANTRSAGFNTVDMTAMTRPSLLLTLLFMFIGAGPGSTAGGIKLTTLAVVIATVYAAIRGEAQVKLFDFKRRVSEKIAYKAVAVVAVSGLWIMVATFLITSFETMEFLPVLFETVSAFATVGLTMGITADLSAPSKLVLILTMYAGRVGVLFILLAMFTARKKSALHYAEEPLLIG